MTSLILTLDTELSDRYPMAGATHFRLDAEEVSEDRGAFLVAYSDGLPVGCGAIRRLDPETAEIKRMYVTQRLRGRGVGHSLLAQLETEGRRLGVRRILLETGVRQPEAIGLYLTSGFVRVPPFGEYLGSSLSVCMAKALTKTPETGRLQPFISTPRLVLTPLVLDDAEPLFEYRSHPDIRRYQSFESRTLPDAREFIAAGLADSAPWRQYGIRLRESAQLAGDIGYRHRTDDPHQAELGITVAPTFQGRGIAAEAVRGLLDHLCPCRR